MKPRAAAARTTPVPGSPASPSPTLPRRLHGYDVIGDEHVVFLVDQDDGGIVGTLIAQGGGWWKGRAPNGDVRELFVADDAGDPRLTAAKRLISP